MELDTYLKLALNNESQKINFKNIKNSSKSISENYRNINKKSITSKDDVLAYALSRMPATYASSYTVLENLKNLIQKTPKTVFDFGAGTGACSFAINNVFNVDTITCFEYQNEMINLGKKLIFYNNELNNKVNWENFDILKNNIKKKADLVTTAYMLNELPKESLFLAVDKMWEATNNLFVIIEPGTPSNFKQMKEIREYLLQKGANLIAPCPHAKACPVENNNWCHFTCRISRIKIHKNLKDAESPFEDEKFTYLVFSKNEKTMAKSRVLRHPIYRPKVVSLELCNNNGKIERLEISKSNENYKLARKIKCGDEFV